MTTVSPIHRLGNPIPADGHARWGRKGYLLSRMKQAGYPVPPGFVLPTDYRRRILAPEWDAELLEELRRELHWLEEVTGRMFGGTARPLILAVRSGAPVSLPGLLRTVLGVGVVATSSANESERAVSQRAASRLRATFPELFSGPRHATDAAELPAAATQWIAAVRAVAESWSTAEATAYRATLGIPDELGTAVIVQAMADVEWTGVMLTRSPEQGGDQKMLIEYAAALTGVVDGRQTPQRVTLARHPGDSRGALDVQADRATVPEPIWNQLRNAALRLEAESFWEAETSTIVGSQRCGLDIEWGSRADELILFQARPVRQEHGRALGTRAWLTEQDGERILVRHGLAESLQHPTPLTWSSVRRMMSGNGALGAMYRRLGYCPGQETFGGGYLELCGGTVYADVAKMARLFDGGIPLRFDRQRLVSGALSLEDGPSQLDPNACGPWFLLGLPFSMLNTCRAAWLTRRQLRLPLARRNETADDARKWIASAESRLKALGTTCDDGRFVQAVASYVLDDLPIETLSWALDADLAMKRMRAILLRHGCDARMAQSLADELTYHLAEWPVSAQAALKWVADGRWSVAQFRQEFGHRGTDEWELAAANYRMLPDDVLIATALRNAPTDRPASNPERDTRVSTMGVRVWKAAWAVDDAQRRLEQRLICTGRPIQRLLLQVQELTKLATGRELARDLWLRTYDVMRQAVWQVARTRHLDRGDPVDLFFLDLPELIELAERPDDGGFVVALGPRCVERRYAWEQDWQPNMPRILGGSKLLRSAATEAPNADADPPSMGTGLSAGRAEGCALHLGDGHDHAAWQRRLAEHEPRTTGTILICESLDTRWIPAIVQSQGVITEQGGMLSHAAVIARQLGIPMVRFTGARHHFPGGSHVEINGETGQVRIVKARE